MGSNLFHSFGTFNINQGESATFTGPNSIANIIRPLLFFNHLLLNANGIAASPIEQNSSMVQTDIQTESPIQATPKKSLSIFLIVGTIINIRLVP